MAAERAQFQPVVSVRLNGEHHMGGCMLDGTHVLTAIGPIYTYVKESMAETIQMLSVYAGSISRTRNGILKSVKDIFYPRQYKHPSEFDAPLNDICVLEVS